MPIPAILKTKISPLEASGLDGGLGSLATWPSLFRENQTVVRHIEACDMTHSPMGREPAKGEPPIHRGAFANFRRRLGRP